MSESTIAVVDERNRITGAATRNEVIARGLWHRSVHCLVLDGDGRVYLSIRDDVVCPGMYDVSLTEHLRGDETFDACVVRGLEARLGVRGAEVRALTGVFVDSDEHPSGPAASDPPLHDNRFMQVFAAIHRGPIEPDARIYSGGLWLGLSELDDFVARHHDRCAPHFLKDWQRVRADLLIGGGASRNASGDAGASGPNRA